MQAYEVEVKSLLGSEENVEALRIQMQTLDPNSKLTSRNTQLNHYFIEGNITLLAKAMSKYFSVDTNKKLEDMAVRGKNFSVRTREKDGTVFLVVKASMGEDTSSNGVTRMEFEEKVPMSLDELDKILLGAEFVYQAKWSRVREEYACKDLNVCLDKNAGYGWLAEFEKVVQSESELAGARQEIDALMQACGVSELPQARLERMFAFYNEHWPEYYGTEKIFTIQ